MKEVMDRRGRRRCRRAAYRVKEGQGGELGQDGRRLPGQDGQSCHVAREQVPGARQPDASTTAPIAYRGPADERKHGGDREGIRGGEPLHVSGQGFDRGGTHADGTRMGRQDDRGDRFPVNVRHHDRLAVPW
jgi:hypothetical protein